MVWQLMFSILIVASLINIFSIEEVFADNFQSAKPTFLWKFQTFIEDIRLQFSSGEQKSELALKFAEQRQNEIDGLLQKGERVPQEIEDRRLQLLDRIEQKQNSVIEDVKQDLQTIGELNRIRILYSEFKMCNDNCTPKEKEQFNNNVNSLNTWKDKCSGVFNIDDYQNTDQSFDKLAEKHCPDLKKYPKLEINRIFKSD